MQMTAVVINSELGDLSIGLEMAGFKVIAAYEADRKAVAAHRANLNTPIFPLPFEEWSIKAVPSTDLLAGRLYNPSHPKSTIQENPKATLHDFLTLLDSIHPRAFFLTFSTSFMKSEQMRILLDETARREYQCAYQMLNVARVTGAPVTERMSYVVGTRIDMRTNLELLGDSFPTPLPPEKFLQIREPVDPWYFNVKIKPENFSGYQSGKRFYNWKSHSYVGTDLLCWNYRIIPLIDTGERLRKITHREIANLKGFPAGYVLPDHTNRSWLYQRLIYAVNVQVIKQIADKVLHALTKLPLQELLVPRELQFANLFGRYLTELDNKAEVRKIFSTRDPGYAFELRIKDQTLYFDLKCYSGRCVPLSRIRTSCERRSPLLESGKLVLVFANEVPETIKSEYLEKLEIFIWDVQNLLWLFQQFEDIKNEFIALLDYSVSDIEPSPPALNEFQEALSKALELPREPASGVDPEAVPDPDPKAAIETDSRAKSKPHNWEDRLRHIEPGRDQSREYEQFCIDILKYALGNYLTLWEPQEQTDDGLHRFDLCCKIKNGVHHDFFDSVKHYFNTKYIVFEFKNYAKKIGQEEIYTTEKYLYGTALRKVAIIISRQGNDANALRAAKGSLRESGKLILCLDDRNLLDMANNRTSEKEEPADFLGEMLDKLLIHLEK